VAAAAVAALPVRAAAAAGLPAGGQGQGVGAPRGPWARRVARGPGGGRGPAPPAPCACACAAAACLRRLHAPTPSCPPIRCCGSTSFRRACGAVCRTAARWAVGASLNLLRPGRRARAPLRAHARAASRPRARRFPPPPPLPPAAPAARPVLPPAPAAWRRARRRARGDFCDRRRVGHRLQGGQGQARGEPRGPAGAAATAHAAAPSACARRRRKPVLPSPRQAWGASLAQRLSEGGVLVACCDYRNFPQAGCHEARAGDGTQAAICHSRPHWPGGGRHLHVAGARVRAPTPPRRRPTPSPPRRCWRT
jgi:hypothetical protein